MTPIAYFFFQIQENPTASQARHCERPKRQVFPLTGLASVELKSRSRQPLKAFRVSYRFLPADEGERLTRQLTRKFSTFYKKQSKKK